MPEKGLGVRHETVATKTCQHGQIVVEDGFVGSAFKTLQLHAFVDPNAKDEEGHLLAQQIAVDEPFDIEMGGTLAAPMVGELEDLEVGDKIWIRQSDNALMPADSSGGTDEVQIVTLTKVTGGHFTLEFDGDTTAHIAASAVLPTAKAIEEALEALADIEKGDVAVTGSAGGPYTVTFKGRYADTDVPTLVAADVDLTGEGAEVAVETSKAGVPGAGNLPVGVITEIDPTRTPAFCRINSNNWQAFLPGA